MADCVEVEGGGGGGMGKKGVKKGGAWGGKEGGVIADRVLPIIKEVFCANGAVQRYVKWGFTFYNSEVTCFHTG